MYICTTVILMTEKRYLHFFVSDVHLGLKRFDPENREERFVTMLEGLPLSTSAVYLLGDIFDFWFEYRYVVPKGFTRVLARHPQKGVDVYSGQPCIGPLVS